DLRRVCADGIVEEAGDRTFLPEQGQLILSFRQRKVPGLAAWQRDRLQEETTVRLELQRHRIQGEMPIEENKIIAATRVRADDLVALIATMPATAELIDADPERSLLPAVFYRDLDESAPQNEQSKLGIRDDASIIFRILALVDHEGIR